MKNHIDITKDDLSEIMHTQLLIGIGDINKIESSESLEGEIIDCSLTPNPPHLPAIAIFQTSNGNIRRLTFYEIKWIKKL